MNRSQKLRKQQRKKERITEKKKHRKIERMKHRAKMISLCSVLLIGSMAIYPTTTKAPENKLTGPRIVNEIEFPPWYKKPEKELDNIERLIAFKEEGERVASERKAREEAERAAELVRREKARIKAEQEAKAREEKARREREAIQARQREQAQADSSGNSGGNVQGRASYEVTMSITAYHAGYESTGKNPNDKWYGITASGTRVTEGRTVACGPSIPFGSRIVIPSLGIDAICEDRGGAIGDRNIDVYIADRDKVWEFGRKSALVKVYLKK